jgi:cell division protein FtsQ
MALIHPEQVELKGNQYVARARVLEIFAADRGRSVLRVPLDQRRRELEAIPWVEHATVLRALPNRIEIEITERTPIAFLRQGSDLALVDAHGVILERPMKGRFHFPVVSGISGDMPAEDRGSRMTMYSSFAQQIDAARPGALEKVSEVDLSDLNDLRATISGLGDGGSSGNAGSAAGTASLSEAWGAVAAPILVHFGENDFEGKYLALVENIGKWRAAVGRVDSVDLRFGREAVVNPDPTGAGQTQAAPKRPIAPAASAGPASTASTASAWHAPAKGAATKSSHRRGKKRARHSA